MKKDELMYTYAYDAYNCQLKRKKEIRDRSYLLFALSTPIFISLTTYTLTNPDDYVYTGLKIFLLIIAGLLFVLSLCCFFLIFLPSKQNSFITEDVLNDTKTIINPDDLVGYFKYKNYEDSFEDFNKTELNPDEIDEAREFLALRFFSNVYSELFNCYAKTLFLFRKYFFGFVILDILSLLVLAVTTGL